MRSRARTRRSPAHAPFVEASGTTLRWDSRDTTNPLLGSVHDPIYQGSRRDLAESGIPEPKLGLVTKAHGGVLFIDEIGEMAPPLQNKLLKVLEDKRVLFESSYYDEHDPNVPAYVKKLFADGAPADFILIGATTRDPEAIDAAIRSRCAAVYFEPLTQAQILRIVDRSGKAPRRAHDEERAGADRHVYERRPQGRADSRRRLRPRALSPRARRPRRARSCAMKM